MKTIKFSSIPALFIVVILLFTGCSAPKKIAGPVVEGTWEFLVAGAPQGDVKGNMVISKTETIYKGTLNMPDGNQAEIRDLAIVNSVLTGKFDYSNMTVTMNGTFVADKYTGTVTTEGYSFTMTATKKP